MYFQTVERNYSCKGAHLRCYRACEVHECYQCCGEKKGALLIQFPASIKFSYFHKIRNLLDQLSSLSETTHWKLAVEFRDKSWYREATYDLMELHRASIVIHDIPKSMPPSFNIAADFVYLRFHGEKGDYRGSYEEQYYRSSANSSITTSGMARPSSPIS